MKYRADVDGLRALAVLPVVLFHAGVPGFSGGYAGVDVFFVISGFVIGKSLFSDIASGTFSIMNFYERRIRRILPALVATIVGSWIFAWFYFLPPAMIDMSLSTIAVATFWSNVYFWRNSGYFEIAATTRPLLHTWSLSVEEQYYVVIPLLLFALKRYSSRFTAVVLVVTAVTSLALSIGLVSRAPTASFFLLPTRAWELLLGTILALLPSRIVLPRATGELIGAAGIGLLAYAVFRFDESTPFPGAAALVPTVGAALLILAGAGSGVAVTRALSWRPLVAIGLISYSLYLVHWPITVFLRYATLHEPGLAGQVSIVAGSLVLAVLSWRFIEQPFRKGGSFGGRLTVFAGAGGVLASLVALGVVGLVRDGFPGRFPGYATEMASLRHDPLAVSWKENVCFLQNQPATAWGGDECVRTTGKSRTAILWGDSFAAHYVPGIVQNADHMTHNIVQYTFAGCPPVLSYYSFARPTCTDFNSNIFEIAKHYKADTVIIASRWDQLRQRGLDDVPVTIRKLRDAGLDVVLIGESPSFGFDVAELAFRKAGADRSGNAAWEIITREGANAHLASLAGTARFVDPMPALCDGRLCTYEVGGTLLFTDFGHFSGTGSDRAVRAYFPLLRR